MAPAMDKFKIFNAMVIIVTLIFGFINVFNHLMDGNFGGIVVTFVITLIASLIAVSNFVNIEKILNGKKPSLFMVFIVPFLYVFVVVFFCA